jgi:iron complex transport system substrate-binding protein
VWLTSGGSLVAAADETWDTVDVELPDTVVKLGGIQNINLELLIAAQPDFVIASANTDAHVELKDALESAGICVAYFYVTTFDDYLKMLKTCTDLTGRTDLYQTNGLDVQTQINEIKKRVTGDAPTVLFIRAASTSVKAKASEDTVGTQILKDLGCINIADSDSALKDNLSIEVIAQADPDYIFVTTQGSKTEAAMENVEKLLKSNAVWSSLTAVKNDRYYVLDKTLYNNKPNKRWGEAYQQLADILYPASK